MRDYQCKIEGAPNWDKVSGDDGEHAAKVYAEEFGIDDGNNVVVRGCGTYSIQTETVFHAVQVA